VGDVNRVDVKLGTGTIVENIDEVIVVQGGTSTRVFKRGLLGARRIKVSSND
jgi:hypothetical protein